MTSPEAVREAGRWLRYALDDLAGAQVALVTPGMVPRHACWLAQQAAEKAIKAALVLLQRQFPRTHDLDALRNRLPDEWAVRVRWRSLMELSQWSVEARYPGDLPDATERDADQAVCLAAMVVESLRQDMADRGCVVT
ncbi:MAG: HEPN domain-containing protein [Anaerolineae bacterium]